MSTLHVLSTLRCDCGEQAQSLCGMDGDTHITGTLIPCCKPICGVAGRSICKTHRHAAGSMGYPASATVKCSLTRFVPDVHGGLRGFIDAIKYAWINAFFSTEKKAWRCLLDQVAGFPPPAPLPLFEITVNGCVFLGGMNVETGKLTMHEKKRGE